MENISFYEFKLLPDYDQYDLVFTKGDFITNHEEGDSRFALYSLYKFFIEVEYNIQNNKIVGIKSFVDGEIMEKYISI